MSALYILNLAAASLFALWPLWFSRRILRLPFLNPFTIAMAISLPVEAMKLFGGPLVLLDDGLFDPGYQFAVLASNVLLLSQMLGLAFFVPCFAALRIERCLPLRSSVLQRADLKRGAHLFLAFYLVAFLLLASAEFGVANWLANPREGYQLHRTGQGHWYALAITALSVSLLLNFLSRPTASAVLWGTLPYLALAYFLGSKMVVLSFFTSTLIFLWFLRWRNLTKLLVIGAPLVFLLLVWNLFLALSDGFGLQSILEYFDYYKNAADYYRGYMSGEIQLYWGEIARTALTSYVPRALWPDKPTVYGVLIINEIFYPGQAEMTNTPAFGGAVEQFADFGFAGIVFSGLFGSFTLLTAAASYLIFRRPGLDLSRITPVMAVVLLVQFVPTFGLFFPGVLYALLALLVALAIRMVRVRRRWRATKPPKVVATPLSQEHATGPRTDSAC